MSPINIQEPFLVGGLQYTNFFNGRVLSGQDLSSMQVAAQEASKRLGRATGEGVAYGMQVTMPNESPTNPVLRIAPGLSVNRSGHALSLSTEVELSLMRSSGTQGSQAVQQAQAGRGTSSFDRCQFPEGGNYVAGSGLYLLTIAPAEVPVGSAPVSGPNNVIAPCNTDYSLEGIQFRLIPFALRRGGLAPVSSLRNRMAHECFGTADTRLTSPVSDPFGTHATAYGLLDDLRSTGALTNCDVPLAVVYWTAVPSAQNRAFVDMWSVRRLITRGGWNDRWGSLVGDRRESEAEAIFLQFEEHIAKMRTSEPDLATIVGKDHFDYLPPAGIIPVSEQGTTGGFDTRRFFGDRASTELGMLNGNTLRALLHEAYYYEPIPLNDPAAEQERIQLYLIWENVQAHDSRPQTQLALVFAAYGLPYRGVARFGYAQRDLSRFARRVR